MLSITISRQRAVIVADGEADPELLRAVAKPAKGAAGQPERALVIGADGGALVADRAGVPPDVVLGDGDSLTRADLERFRTAGAEVRLVAPQKDESDTELCLLEAVARGIAEIQLIGALGGARPEHTLANIALLALPELADRTVSIVHRASRMELLGSPTGPSRFTIRGRAGDFISLQPLGEGAEGVTTEGLRYPLKDEPLPYGPSRGLSNELVAERATVSIRRGRLLVTHTSRGAA